MHAVWPLFGIVWLYCIYLLLKRGPGSWPGRSKNKIFFLFGVIWTVIAICSLSDLQLGHRLYYSTIALDYSVRTQFIHAISAGGIPPANPFFYPGQPEPLRYHYFWLSFAVWSMWRAAALSTRVRPGSAARFGAVLALCPP